MARNLWVEDLTTLTFADVQGFLAMEAPVDARPVEGFRLDYKAEPIRELGEVATAFANTVGGLVIVGVKEGKEELRGRPVEISGYEPDKGDPKLNLINAILASVHPMPEVEVGIASVPEPVGRVVAVIRVGQGWKPPYMWILGGENKISMRVDARNKMVGPLELEALITRGRAAADGQEELSLLTDRNFQPLAPAAGGKRVARESFFQVVVRPERPMRLLLDHAAETRVIERLVNVYMESAGPWARSSTHFDCLVSRSHPQTHQRWRISTDVGIMCSAETLLNDRVSVSEMAVDFALALRAVRLLLEDFEYWGRVRVATMWNFPPTMLELGGGRGGTPNLEGISLLDNVARLECTRPPDELLDHSELVAPAPFMAACLLQHLREQWQADVELKALEVSLAATVEHADHVRR